MMSHPDKIAKRMTNPVVFREEVRRKASMRISATELLQLPMMRSGRMNC